MKFGFHKHFERVLLFLLATLTIIQHYLQFSKLLALSNYLQDATFSK